MKTFSKKRVREMVDTFIPCYVFWLLLTMSVAPVELVSGAVVCLITAWFASGFFIKSDADEFKLLSPAKLGQLIVFGFIIFPWEMLKANVAMAKTVLLNQPLKQAIVKVKVEGITNFYALATLADCITLTPGTITLDVSREGDEVYMYVQWLTMETEDNEKAGEIIKGNMERWIRRIWE